MNQVIGIFLIGVMILAGAIVINIIAGVLGINGWYDFINDVGEIGFREAIKELGIISVVYMVLIYPILLGIIGYYSYLLVF